MSNTAFTPAPIGRVPSAPAFMQATGAADSDFAPTPPGGFQRRAHGNAVQPRHFAPADPQVNPTEGWDPFAVPQTAGFSDPLAAAREAGFAAGYAAGHAAGLEEIACEQERQVAFEARLAEALAENRHFDRDRTARYLRETVLQLVTKMVGEQAIEPNLLAARITAATELLGDSAEAAVVRMHPADLEKLEGRFPENFFPAGDASLQPGAFVIESASTVVEDGPDLWIEQLTAAIERVPLPAIC